MLGHGEERAYEQKLLMSPRLAYVRVAFETSVVFVHIVSFLTIGTVLRFRPKAILHAVLMIKVNNYSICRTYNIMFLYLSSWWKLLPDMWQRQVRETVEPTHGCPYQKLQRPWLRGVGCTGIMWQQSTVFLWHGQNYHSMGRGFGNCCEEVQRPCWWVST